MYYLLIAVAELADSCVVVSVTVMRTTHCGLVVNFKSHRNPFNKSYHNVIHT